MTPEESTPRISVMENDLSLRWYSALRSAMISFIVD